MNIDPDYIKEIIEKLWDSDNACALTNQAARALEALLEEREENEGVIRCLRRHCDHAENIAMHAYKQLSGFREDHEVPITEALFLLPTVAYNAHKTILETHGVNQ